jgi:hypothetical protein
MKSTIGNFVVYFLVGYGTLVVVNTMFSWHSPQLWMLSTAASVAVASMIGASIGAQWVSRRDAQRNR